jgi:hypothetical protein
MVAAKIFDDTNKEVEFVGLGAGSETYLPGSAQSQGLEKGAADLQIVGTNIHLEVTGPLVDSVKKEDPLWIRPDKIDHAQAHFPEQETWVVHHLPRNDLLRVINLNVEFFNRYKASEFKLVSLLIRGTRERYIEISATDPLVLPWNVLVSRLKP